MTRVPDIRQKCDPLYWTFILHGNTLLSIEIHLIPIIANIKNDGRTRNNVWRMKYFHLRCDNQITCNGIKDYPKSVTNANCSYGISVMFWAKWDSLSTWLGDFSQPEREMTFTSDVLQLFSFISLWRNRFLLLLQRGGIHMLSHFGILKYKYIKSIL